jgi:hypothetical protein
MPCPASTLKGVQGSPLRGSDPGAAVSAKHLAARPVRLDAMQARVAECDGEPWLQVE